MRDAFSVPRLSDRTDIVEFDFHAHFPRATSPAAHRWSEVTMKFLCLAYGDEKDWQMLSKVEQDALLARDEVLRQRGDLVAAVREPIVTLRAWDGRPHTTDG